MNRRGFLASLGVMAAPWERERVYSFTRAPGLVTICCSEVVCELGSPFVTLPIGMPWQFFGQDRFVSALPGITLLAPGETGVLIAGEPIAPGVELHIRNAQTTDAAIAREIRRQKAALDARGIWS